MSAAIKASFLSTWDRDLSDIWKFIAPVLPDIRYRSGNDAAAKLCTFSKNWRVNRKHIRQMFDSGLQQQQQEQEEEGGRSGDDSEKLDQREQNETTNATEIQSMEDTDKTACRDDGGNNKQKRSISGKQPHRPLSPAPRRRSSAQSAANVSSMTQSNPYAAPRREKRGRIAKVVVRTRNQRDDVIDAVIQVNSGANGVKLNENEENAAIEKLQSYMSRLSEVEAELEQMRDTLTQHKDRSSELMAELEELQQLNSELRADNARLADRVAELNQAADEQVEKQLHPPHRSSTERNSPLAVAQEYERMCSNEWQEAREALDEYSDFKVKVKDKCEILTSTLTECYKTAVEAHDNHKTVLSKLLQDPFTSARHALKMKKPQTSSDDVTSGGEESRPGGDVSRTATGLSPELDDALLKYMAVQSDAIDHRHTSKYVIASTFATLHPLLVDHDITRSARIRHFVRACLQLSWKMVIQRPCMTFNMDDVGATFDDVTHELHPDSESADTAGALLDYYVHPVMMQEDKVMQKALVVLATPQQ